MKEKNNNGKKISPQILVPMIIGAICVITILVVVGFVTPKRATAGQLQENLNLGSKYLEAGEYDKAEVAFKDALKIDKKSTDATLGLAKVYNGKKQPEKALDMLKAAGKNMKNTSKSSLKKNVDVWNSRVNEYQNTFAQTKSLFAQQGNTSQIQAAEKEEKTIIEYVTVVINITPEATSPEESMAAPITESPEESIAEPTTKPTSGSLDNGSGRTVADSGDVQGKNSIDDSDSKKIGKKSGMSETPSVIPKEPEIPSVTPKEEPETPSITPKVSEVPSVPPEEPEVPSVSPETPSVPPEEPETPNITEMPPEIPDITEIPPENPDITETPISEEPIQEPDNDNTEPEQPEKEENNTEQTENYETEMPGEDEILAAYAAQMETSKYVGGTIEYTDSSSIDSVNGILATEQRDFDGDQRPELLVISVSGGKLEIQLYRAENGEAQQIAYETAEQGFGDPVEGITYSGSQECFIKDNGTSTDIGIVGYYSGMTGESGTLEVRLSVAMYKVNSDGTLNMAGNAALVNGTQLYLNGMTPQDGGKDAFIGELSNMGLNGSWVSESADIMASMDLNNNPMQDTAGVPNPVNEGLSLKETGIQDLTVINAGMQPGSSSMDFSVK